MNCKVSLNVTAVRTGDNVAHESPVLCNLLLRKSPLTSVLCLWELFPACQTSHPKSFAPYRRVMMQSFWGLYRCLVGGKKTTWAIAVECPSCCQNVWRGLNNKVGDQSYFLLVYKLPQWDNRTYRGGDERSLPLFTLRSHCWFCPDSFFHHFHPLINLTPNELVVIFHT